MHDHLVINLLAIVEGGTATTALVHISVKLGPAFKSISSAKPQLVLVDVNCTLILGLYMDDEPRQHSWPCHSRILRASTPN